MSVSALLSGNVSVLRQWGTFDLNGWRKWAGDREGARGERWEDDKQFPSSSSRQEEAARLRKSAHTHTQTAARACVPARSQTHTKALILFVYMQISKWGWPTERKTVGGHGKHIMVLACNDTLSVRARFVCVRRLKIDRVRAQRGTWKHKTLSSLCLSVSRLIFYCTALVHLTEEIALSVCLSARGKAGISVGMITKKQPPSFLYIYFSFQTIKNETATWNLTDRMFPTGGAASFSHVSPSLCQALPSQLLTSFPVLMQKQSNTCSL